MINIPLQDQAAQDAGRKQLPRFLFSKTGADQCREFTRCYYHQMAFERTTQIREVFTLLAGQRRLPAIIHCTAGKDRTGFLVALIQLLAGVPYELVRGDYLRTNDHFRPRLERFSKVASLVTLFQLSPGRVKFILNAHAEILDEVHGNIIHTHGTVERYLAEACQIETAALQQLKDQLLAS